MPHTIRVCLPINSRRRESKMIFAGACWTNFTQISPQGIARDSSPRAYADTSDATATRAARGILLLAESNYEVNFAPGSRLSQRVLFPPLPARAMASKTPVSSDSRTTTQLHLLRDLHRLRRKNHPATIAGDAGLRPFQIQHTQRTRRAEQRHGPVPPQNQRTLRHALPPGRREHSPDVLGQNPFLADPDLTLTRPTVGIHQDRQLRLADRNGGRLARVEPGVGAMRNIVSATSSSI